MKKIIGYLASAVTGAAVLVGVQPVPAEASPLCSTFGICGKIRVPDDAYRGWGVIVGCNWDPEGDGGDYAAPARIVWPGESSKKYCGKDTDGVWVPSRREIWCVGIRGWEKKWDRFGWHKYRDYEGTHTCEQRRD
jgi:hypothetical protein